MLVFIELFVFAAVTHSHPQHIYDRATRTLQVKSGKVISSISLH